VETQPKLTPKQKAFCQEYLIDKNATQAAIRAGYKPQAAYASGHENLRKPQVKAYLDPLLTQQAERTKISGDAVISELAAIASFQLTDVIELSNGKLTIKGIQAWSDTAKRAVESLKIDKDGCIHIKAHSKVAALKQLGEHFGLFTDYNTALQALVKYGYVTWLEDGKGFQFRESLDQDSPQTEDVIDGRRGQEIRIG
jgi:phage terminase small subunit